jgi:hypothetical protein
MGEVGVEMEEEMLLQGEVEGGKAKKLCNATNVINLVTIKMNVQSGKMQTSVKSMKMKKCYLCLIQRLRNLMLSRSRYGILIQAEQPHDWYKRMDA